MAGLVARRKTEGWPVQDWLEAEATAEVDQTKELEQREMCRNLDSPHWLGVLHLVGPPSMLALLVLEQRKRFLREGNVRPQRQG